MRITPDLIIDLPEGARMSLAAIVREAVGSMDQWSHSADRATVALAVLMAEQIDGATERAELARGVDLDERLARWCDVAETLERLGPKLHAILRDLGATPAGRKDVKLTERPAGRLAQLRKGARAK